MTFRSLFNAWLDGLVPRLSGVEDVPEGDWKVRCPQPDAVTEEDDDEPEERPER